ncbi:hypothetical protein WAJ69_19520, partial [Acinetobacter baumannii]
FRKKPGVTNEKNIFQEYRCLKCKYRFKQKKYPYFIKLIFKARS